MWRREALAEAWMVRAAASTLGWSGLVVGRQRKRAETREESIGERERAGEGGKREEGGRANTRGEERRGRRECVGGKREGRGGGGLGIESEREEREVEREREREVEREREK